MATGGLLIKPKYSFEDCPDLDILVVPGGVGSREVIKDNYILSMINKISKKSEILLSICSGVLILGKNGLFDNKKYCTHHAVYNEAEQIISNGIPCKEDRFIKVAGRIFSSAGVTAGIDASFAVIYDLYGSDKVEKTKTYMEYSSY